jgi:hypothetical protein
VQRLRRIVAAQAQGPVWRRQFEDRNIGAVEAAIQQLGAFGGCRRAAQFPL